MSKRSTCFLLILVLVIHFTLTIFTNMRGWLAIALYFALVYAAPLPSTRQSKSRQQVLARQDPQPSSSNNRTSTPTSTPSPLSAPPSETP